MKVIYIYIYIYIFYVFGYMLESCIEMESGLKFWLNYDY
jgi:hypothetical protein